MTLAGKSMVRLHVVDEETGKPVDAFTVIKGELYTEDDANWEDFNPMTGRDGDFQMEIESSQILGRRFALQVQASGYLPGVSAGYRGKTNLVVKLKRGLPPHGTVVDVAGKPVAGAQLVLADDSGYAYMDNPPLFRPIGRSPMVQSQADGSFELPITLNSIGVYAAHEAGFGRASFDELKESKKLVLKPWARVEGKLKVGDRVTDDQSVSLHRSHVGYFDRKNLESHLSLYAKAKPAPDGSFAFKYVPPMDLEISLEYPALPNREIQWSHHLPLRLEPGQKTNVVIGGGGRSVKGRVRLAPELAAQAALKDDVHKLVRVSSIRPPIFQPLFGAKTQEEIRQAIDAFNRRQREFFASEEGRRYRSEQAGYILRFDSEGNFLCHNVPPGSYSLLVNLTKPGSQQYSRETVATLAKAVTIEAGETDVDLGELALRKQPRVIVGMPAPEIPMKTMDGKPVRLSDFRGRTVLLCFWDATQPGSQDRLKALRDLHGRTKDLDKVAIVLVAAGPQAKGETLQQEGGKGWNVVTVETQDAQDYLSSLQNPNEGFSPSKTACLINSDGMLMTLGVAHEQAIAFVDQLVGQRALSK